MHIRHLFKDGTNQFLVVVAKELVTLGADLSRPICGILSTRFLGHIVLPLGKQFVRVDAVKQLTRNLRTKATTSKGASLRTSHLLSGRILGSQLCDLVDILTLTHLRKTICGCILDLLKVSLGHLGLVGCKQVTDLEACHSLASLLFRTHYLLPILLSQLVAIGLLIVLEAFTDDSIGIATILLDGIDVLLVALPCIHSCVDTAYRHGIGSTSNEATQCIEGNVSDHVEPCFCLGFFLAHAGVLIHDLLHGIVEVGLVLHDDIVSNITDDGRNTFLCELTNTLTQCLQKIVLKGRGRTNFDQFISTEHLGSTFCRTYDGTVQKSLSRTCTTAECFINTRCTALTDEVY